MLNLYPPILEERANAIPEAAIASLKYYTIYFNLPNLVKRADINHIQVVLKYKNTGESAVNASYSPDRATLFLETAGGLNSNYFGIDGNLYFLKIPYSCFIGGAPAKNQTYTAQVRFGSNALWANSTETPGANPGWANKHFENYGLWRKNSVNQVPSNFGEWSNAQTVFCHGMQIASDVTYDLINFVPTIHWQYQDEDNIDPIRQVTLTYTYKLGTEEIVDSIVVGNINDNGTYNYSQELPIAPLTTIRCIIEAITKNYAVITNTCVIYPVDRIISGLNDKQKIVFDEGIWSSKDLATITIEGEEINDGILAKSYGYIDNGGISHSYIQDLIDLNVSVASVYRINMNDLTTVKLFNIDINSAIITNPIIKIKDYTVAMGEEYIYFVFANENRNNDKLYGLTKLIPFNENNQGYGRLMKMDSSYLTTKYHQLRLQGNMQVSSFKRNTQDQLQETIGGKYPHYTRVAKKNYRSFNVNAVISINLDPTSTFLKLNREAGLEWQDNNTSKVIIYNKDIFNSQEVSLSRRREKDIASGGESIQHLREIATGLNTEFSTPGPKTIYGDYLYKQEFLQYGPDKEDQTVYIERKYRDLVMEWLSDGKPKLYRSETEGNMIVMLSDITFSPYDSSNRVVYSVSFNCTEIADYNLQNLLEYQLVPSVIEVDYNAIDLYKFNAGNIDPYLYPGIIFRYDKSINIPAYQIGKTIEPIDVSQYVLNATDKNNLTYSFVNIDGTSYGNSWKGLTINTNGIISGTVNGAEPEGNIYLKVKDNISGKESSILIYHGAFYPPLSVTGTLPSIPSFNYDISTNPINVDVRGYWAGGYLYPGSHYHFSAINLPYGLTISDEGIISGCVLSTIPAGIAQVICQDDYGNSISANISYGACTGPLIFNKLEEFEVKGGIQGSAITPIDFSLGVEGGKPGYTFTAIDLPSGFSLSPVGLLTGSRNIITDGGLFTIIATDAAGSQKQIEIAYGKFYPPLQFIDSGSFDIIEHTVGDTITPFEVRSAISGGLPYDNEPCYIIKAKNLSPNYTIDEYGTISGTVTETGVARTAELYAYDRDGNEAKITINIGAVNPTLGFNGTTPHPIATIKRAGESYDPAVEHWRIPYSDFDLTPVGKITVTQNSGDTNDYVTTKITSHYDPTDLANSYVDIALVKAVTNSNPTSSPTDRKPFNVYFKASAGGKNTTLAICLTNGINPAFNYGGISKWITHTIPGTMVGEEIDTVISIPYTNGIPPYRVSSENVDDLNGLSLTVEDFNATTITLRLKGIIKKVKHNGDFIKIRLIDQANHICTYSTNGVPTDDDYIKLIWREVYPKLTIKPFVNKMTNSAGDLSTMSDIMQTELYFICNKTNITPAVQIVVADGGNPPYKFEVLRKDNTWSRTFDNGLTFPTGTGGANSGKISGRVTTSNERYNYGPRFRVTDSSGHIAYTAEDDIWYMPRSTNDIRLVNGSVTINGLRINSICDSNQMFEVNNVPHGYLTYNYVPTDPIFRLPKSIGFNTATFENIYGQVLEVNTIEQSFTFTLTRIQQPEDIYNWTPGDTTLTSTVTIGPISGLLYIDSNNNPIAKELEVGAYVVIDLTSMVWYGGGQGNKTITFSGLPAGFSQIDPANPLIIGGTPTGAQGENSVTVTITDELMATASTTIRMPIIKAAVAFNAGASITIPELRIGQSFAEINLTNLLRPNTGVAPYKFTFNNNIDNYGYKIEQRIDEYYLMGIAASKQDAITLSIKVSDSYGISDNIVAQIGAIYDYFQVGAISIPPGLQLSSIATINLDEYVSGGKAPYTWRYGGGGTTGITTFTENGITWHLDHNNNTLYMDGNIRPNAVIDEHDLLFTVTDTAVNGTALTKTVTIRVGKVGTA